ncbi:hypothetical protein [Parafrankia sp. BMG5.11]|uniref:CC_3452 family protein n=1 Tax=Parafrankia sp. BMG5.11 TaxID=222540 RepID=UPI00103A0AF2|nr:hypothetical protein [Parafrankia sp. BMG5.11]TCJ39748.1 hypothetical protein E0504_07310 [Parafrankia sp. BMG5.11]
MTFVLPRSAKPLAAIAAFAWTALSIGAAVTPAPAYAAESAYYRAELAAPAAKASAISGGVAWKCAETECAAGKGTSRPAIVCARLVKAVGPVNTFTAGGKALDAEDLARCNAR